MDRKPNRRITTSQMNVHVKPECVTFRRMERSLHEELLFTPEMPTVEYIDSKRVFIDAVKRGLTIFNLANFLEPTKWTKLTHLYLARNELTELPSELFYQAENLVWLDVRRNELLRFPTTIKGHACLKTILLEENHLARLPIEFGSLENLQCLSVSNNPLEFPSPETISKCRANGDLIAYLRRCWQEQSTDVFPVPQREIGKRKRVSKKLAPLRKVKDHTEVICRLRNSGKIKDQIRAEKMLQMLEFEHKLLQSFKDQDVLKKWRDTYKESQGRTSSNDVRSPNLSSLLFSQKDTSKAKGDLKKYFIGDIDSAISDLQRQLRQSTLSRTCSADTGTDPEHVMKEKSREISNIKDIQKKITYLRQRCGT